MHLSAAIRAGVTHLHKDVYKSPSTRKPRLFKKTLLTPLPLGAKKCAPPSQKMQYFKRVLFVIINFLFATIIHVRVNLK